MVFDRFKGYGFIHHRTLNNHPALKEGLSLLRDFPERTHIFEGDICWDFSGSNELFYFRHPSYVFDVLSPAQIRNGLERRELVGLHHLDEIKPTNAFLVVELKVGKGKDGRSDWERALFKLVEHLEQNFSGRYWIDSFSLPMLQYVKKVSPKTTVTLHTECVYRGHVLIGAPEFPPFRVRNLINLQGVDGIAIRRRGTESFMATACANVHESGKVLVLSRLHNLREFECSKIWKAAAGYMHWKFSELVELNDSIDSRMMMATHRL